MKTLIAMLCLCAAAYGAAKINTPNVDRPAKEGRRFTDAHSPAAVCTPTRYAFMTGEYAWRKQGTGILPGIAGPIIEPGRLAYVATALGSVFLQTRLRELADLITELVAQVSPEPAPFTVDAPEGRIANLTIRDDLRVLHLTNVTEPLTPMDNVRIRLRRPARRMALLAKGEFEQKDWGDVIGITVSGVEAYPAIRLTP